MNIVSQIKKVYEWIKEKIKKVLIALGFIGIATAATLTASDLNTNDVSIESFSNKYQTATEIKAEYSLENASLIKTEVKNQERDKYTGEFKDEVKVEIGEVKTISTPIMGGLLGAKDEQVIEPSIKLTRWGEVNFKLKPILDAKVSERKMSFDKNKIIFETPKISFEMYDITDGEGGYKYIWYLNEKPANNIVEFDIETSGLDFFYQPPLTQEYQNGYSEQFQKEIVVSETQVKDLEGNILVERPENVVGSYVFYHKTKGGMVDAWGKAYGTGQGGIIYRPKLIDTNGMEGWGKLNITWTNEEKTIGIYSVEIPQDFLDKAVYPIKSNDTFGYETAPATDNTWAYNTIRADYPYSPTSSGIISKLVVFSENSGSINDGYFRPVIYKNSDNTLIGYGPGVTMGDSQNWVDAVLDNGGTIVALTEYMLGGWLGPDEGLSMPSIAYNSATNIKARDAYTYHATNSPPNPCSWSAGKPNASLRWGIYATYTPSGGGAVEPIINRNQIIE